MLLRDRNCSSFLSIFAENPRMISFEEAMRLVQLDIEPTGTENVVLAECHGRVLAADVFSDTDMPPFDKAAVDGYACRRQDLSDGVVLNIIEVISAGSVPAKVIKACCCAKIMTGAVIPEGADCVVMVEQTSGIGEKQVMVVHSQTKDNIARKAEELRDGELVMSKGTLIHPQQMAVLAAVGASIVQVYKKVHVCVMSTGDELVEPEYKPGQGKIRNSNAVQLMAQVQRLGAIAEYGGIIPDNENDTRLKILKGLKTSQVLILSGGISMGDFDFVPRILDELRMKILFKTIAVQPGKPTVFARNKNSFVFALPGNPVSSFNIFELLAKPFLYKLMGHEYFVPVLRLPLGEAYSRKAKQRLGFAPAIISPEGHVIPVHYHGSAHIHALTKATALIEVPLGTGSIGKGELVHVRFI